MQVFSLSAQADSLEKPVAKLRAFLTDFSKISDEESKIGYQSQAHWFYKIYMQEVIESYPRKSKLIISPDGLLNFVPFEVFLTKQVLDSSSFMHLPYLLRTHSIRYSYSAGLLLENHAEESNRNGLFAAAANYRSLDSNDYQTVQRSARLNTLRARLTNLPAARSEVLRLQERYQGTFLLDEACNENSFKRNAQNYAIIHLAMHGLVNTETPIFSSLAFTENNDTTEDNFLEAWEISQLDLKADLVVLSACETGFGKLQEGEGVRSLARSFMYAGVSSLVVSLWQVSDASTADIMSLFYEYLYKGLDKSEALRRAKLNYIKQATESEQAHPAFWAHFIMIGDDEPISLSTSKYSATMWWVAAGGGILLLTLSFWWFRKKRGK